MFSVTAPISEVRAQRAGRRSPAMPVYASLIAILVWFVIPMARAVDPLPPDVENAAPEVQMRYLERTGRESHEKKLEVGQKRYEQRVRTRQAIHQQMAGEVASRQAQMGDAMAMFSTGLQGASLLLIVFVLFIGAIVVGLGVRAWLRFRHG